MPKQVDHPPVSGAGAAARSQTKKGDFENVAIDNFVFGCVATDLYRALEGDALARHQRVCGSRWCRVIQVSRIIAKPASSLRASQRGLAFAPDVRSTRARSGRRVPASVEVRLLGPQVGPVRSSQGTEVVATVAYRDAPVPDIVMVPGGAGARPLASGSFFLDWLRHRATPGGIVTSVCTVSALLAAAGLLDGYRATSNKLAFEWASAQRTRVQWASSGVAAGMDMTAALLASLFGRDEAERAAREMIELELHTDPDPDPFAVAVGFE